MFIRSMRLSGTAFFLNDYRIHTAGDTSFLGKERDWGGGGVGHDINSGVVN